MYCKADETIIYNVIIAQFSFEVKLASLSVDTVSYTHLTLPTKRIV